MAISHSYSFTIGIAVFHIFYSLNFIRYKDKQKIVNCKIYVYCFNINNIFYSSLNMAWAAFQTLKNHRACEKR